VDFPPAKQRSAEAARRDKMKLSAYLLKTALVAAPFEGKNIAA